MTTLETDAENGIEIGNINAAEDLMIVTVAAPAIATETAEQVTGEEVRAEPADRRPRQRKIG